MIKESMNNERGFVLITALLMLTVLLIIGIAATNTTTIELQISGNDKVAKQTFYQAEAGTQVGIELLEECIDREGYTTDDSGSVHINTRDFHLNPTTMPVVWTPADGDVDGDDDVDAYLPNATVPRTDLIFRGITTQAPGDAMHMVSGYDGNRPGVIKRYDISSRHYGTINSEATIMVEWDHRF